MNYLQIAQKVHLILRIGDETPGTQPTAVAGQTGVLSEIVSWVAGAHDDICRARTDWSFMLGLDTFTLAQGGRVLAHADMQAQHATYDAVVPFVGNDCGFIGIVPSAVAGAAEMPVVYVPYQRWQGNYDAPPVPSGMPAHFTVRPDGALEFDATADQDYTLRLNYRKLVVPLTVDASTPMFDARYHNAIVWWAIRHYYCPSRDKSNETAQKAEIELRREMSKLYNEQLPDFLL